MNHSNNHVTELIKETLILTAAMAIVAGAVYFFLLPSHASVSSISGLGIILSNFVPLPLSAITMILNILLLIIGFFTCGKEFGAKTVYTSIVLPLPFSVVVLGNFRRFLLVIFLFLFLHLDFSFIYSKFSMPFWGFFY